MVSKASEDLPEPDRPVNTTSWSRGMATSMFFRLCSRAPRMVIWRASRAGLRGRSGMQPERSKNRRALPVRAGVILALPIKKAGPCEKAKGRPFSFGFAAFLELFGEADQGGVGRQIERLHDDRRAAEGAGPGAVVGIAVFETDEPHARQHLFDTAADGPAGAGDVIGLRIGRAGRDHAGAAGRHRAAFGRREMLPLDAAGQVKQQGGIQQITETPAQAGVPGLLDLAVASGARRRHALKGIDVTLRVAPGEIAFDADQPVRIELPVVAEVEAAAERGGVIALLRK